MSDTTSQRFEAAIQNTRANVDRSLLALTREMRYENTLIEESPSSRLQKVLKIYRGIKPLLAVLGTLPLMPSNWRGAIVIFTQALDALAGADFKAGKDL